MNNSWNIKYLTPYTVQSIGPEGLNVKYVCVSSKAEKIRQPFWAWAGASFGYIGIFINASKAGHNFGETKTGEA